MTTKSSAVKAPVTPPFATMIRSRRPEFKTHRHIGQVQNAVCHYLRFNKDYLGRGRGYGNDGTFRESMTVYQFNAESGEYEVWIDIRKDDRRSDHPDLMPKRAMADPPSADPPDHHIAIKYEHRLMCADHVCIQILEWVDGSRLITSNAMAAMTRDGWTPRNGGWYCPKHGGGHDREE